MNFLGAFFLLRAFNSVAFFLQSGGPGSEALATISVVMLPVNFVTLLAAIFAAGRATQKLDDVKDTLGKLEGRVERLESRRTIWDDEPPSHRGAGGSRG